MIVWALLGVLFAAVPVFAQANTSFIDTFFIQPLVQGTGYNIVNTLTFAIILIGAVFGTYRLLRSLGVRMDRRFFLGILPFIALGGILRSWEDLAEATGVTRNFLFVTPLIYVTMFCIALGLLLVSIGIARITKKVRYEHVWFVLGAIIDITILTQLRFTNGFAVVAVLFITLVWIVAFLIVKFIAQQRLPKFNRFLSGENMFIILAHLFDASTTFVALQYLGYFEQHVLPGFLIGIVGAWAMFALKIVVVPIVLYAFDRELKGEKETEQRTFLKIVVLILGLGPGLRNWLRMIGGF